MSLHDFNSQRLFIDAPMTQGTVIACERDQSNYLVNVLRMALGDELLVFNGVDGEWLARLTKASKKAAELTLEAQRRAQVAGPDIDYLFAPLKRARLDYMVQKATEMGVRRLRPVLTERTIAERVNLKRMRANAIEAAEQCGILHVPETAEPEKLRAVLEAWDADRPLIFCDEGAEEASPIMALEALRDAITPAARGADGDGGAENAVQSRSVAVLIGPEGGFSTSERAFLMSRPYVTAISLGPRIMRADTAAVAALALVNAVLGDWS